MNILFFETTPEDEQGLHEILSKEKGIEFQCIRDILSLENVSLAENADAVSVFINSQVNAEIIDKLKSVKLITTRSTGFDHIDTKAAAEKKIVVANVPAYGSRTVAEFAFSLILGLSRKSFAAYRQIKDRHDFDISHFEGFNLQGKTLGVVGTGRIGQNVIKIAKGFEMEVLGFDAFPKKELETTLGFKYVPLEELLSKSDVITLHVPYNQDTHHLLNEKNMGQIKKGAILVNTARGEVVDTQSLLKAINDGVVSAAGLDVLEGERQMKDETSMLATGKTADFKTLLENHVLIDLPQVAITPHIAFFTKEAKREILQTSVDNLLSFSQGKSINTVK